MHSLLTVPAACFTLSFSPSRRYHRYRLRPGGSTEVVHRLRPDVVRPGSACETLVSDRQDAARSISHLVRPTIRSLVVNARGDLAAR